MKTTVVKGLLYPESAQFSNNNADWTFSRSGNICSVSSVVYAKGQNKKLGKSSFLVKIQYDDMFAEVSYVQIGTHVSYDATKKK